MKKSEEINTEEDAFMVELDISIKVFDKSNC